jgi:hypothetical protein
VLVAAVAAIGIAVGMALPHNTPASIALLALATACVVVAVRDESVAPLHGLHRVVRLPWRRSLSATAASFAARVAGSARALVTRRRPPTAIVLDEPDDEAESWWGAPATPASAEPTPASPEPASPEPVLAAPLRSAQVAAPGRLHKVRAFGRRRFDALARRMSPTDDAGVDVSVS